MRELNFETGLVTYTLNGVCEVKFNPTDNDFSERLFNAFDDLEKKHEGWKKQVEKMVDKREIFAFMRERDAEMRAIIDDLFGAPVCDACFGNMSVYALADGLPVWVNLFLAVMDKINTTFAREQKMTNEKIRKYTEKYHK